MARKRGGRPVPLGEVIQERLRILGWQKRVKEQEILSHWEKAVGSRIAQRTRPVDVTNRRLTIAVDSPVWVQQLTFMKKDLLARFDALLGKGIIREICFTSGVPEKPSEKPTPPLRKVHLSRESIREIDEEASHITDGDLRKAFRDVLLAASRRKENPP